MPPRRQPAPKTESRVGLVVALVFFILTTIILGVTTYMGFDGQKELEGKAKTAQDDVKKANDAERETRAELTAYQVLVGAEQTNRNLAELGGNDTFVKKARTIVDNFGQIGLAWNAQAGAAQETIHSLMMKLLQQLATAQDNEKKALAEAEKAKTDYIEKANTAEAAKKQAETKHTQANESYLAAQAAADAAKNFAIDKIKQMEAREKDLQVNSANAADALTKQVKQANETIAGNVQTLNKYKSEQDAQRQTIIATDIPQGQVKKVDSVNGTAYIGLGAADYVRPGMSFSILMNYDRSRYGVEDALPKKATLTVTQVLGEKQSQASIKYEPDVNPIQSPVEVGDSLYKPGWRRGTPVRWALVGHFDLNGLGRDETKLLVDRLKKQGIIVDAYLDLATLKVVGELNHNIDYLIVGNRPTGETARVIGEERKKQIEEAMNGMISQAQNMGITVMPHRVFLPVSGIELPSKPGLPYFPGGGAGGAPTGGEKPAEKPKDEGK